MKPSSIPLQPRSLLRLVTDVLPLGISEIDSLVARRTITGEAGKILHKHGNETLDARLADFAAGPTDRLLEALEYPEYLRTINNLDLRNCFDVSKCRTALDVAVLSGNIYNVKALLEAGAFANAVDSNGTPVLLNASSNLPIAKLLVEHGADINAPRGSGINQTVLFDISGSPEVFDFLFLKGMELEPDHVVDMRGYLLAIAKGEVAPVGKLTMNDFKKPVGWKDPGFNQHLFLNDLKYAYEHNGDIESVIQHYEPKPSAKPLENSTNTASTVG